MTTPRATPSSRASARVDGSGGAMAQRARADALAQLVLELRAQPTAESRSRPTIRSISELAFISGAQLALVSKPVPA